MNKKFINQNRPERRDAAQNRQRILDVAIKLFKKNGVEQVSMNQIAIAAQIGPGTLYRRYHNKSELCMDLIKDNIDLLFNDIDRYLSDNRETSPAQRLRGLLKLFIHFRETKAQLLAGVESTPAASNNHTQKSPIYNELHKLFVTLFEEMNNQHTTDSIFAADMLLAALSKDFYRFQRNVRGYSPSKILEQLCLMFSKR
ncbi:TetR/AcrR family transcriptional regulator [Pectinatus frisingensis]|uniref:TetR/AcrR family transcriptional regulator n=1 Tax=Pectinatus frisingensis TaxID=865 RepID=UPI0018C8560D|nr:TetR/AcrR family transcriptional regulator [Pectinatus frisingensis]